MNANVAGGRRQWAPSDGIKGCSFSMRALGQGGSRALSTWTGQGGLDCGNGRPLGLDEGACISIGGRSNLLHAYSSIGTTSSRLGGKEPMA